MTDSDFQSITEGLCDSDGQLGPAEFEVVMRRQIKHMTQAKLALVGGVRSADDLEFMQFGALKMVLLEQVCCWICNICSGEVGGAAGLSRCLSESCFALLTCILKNC